MTATIIPAQDVARVIYEEMRAAVEETLPGLTEAEREELLAEFLDALSRKMFGG